MSIKLLLVFAATEFLVSLTPGPAVLLVVSQGMKSGFRASLKGTLGIEAGNAFFFSLSALGLGAVLVASRNLFEFIRWAGVAYLILSGLRMLLQKAVERGQRIEAAKGSDSSLKLVSQGVLTQLINPKAILFFTALLPQFVSTTRPMLGQFVVLGVVSLLVEIPILAAYGWLASTGGRLLPRKFASLPDRVAGAFLIGAGTGLASLRTL